MAARGSQLTVDELRTELGRSIWRREMLGEEWRGGMGESLDVRCRAQPELKWWAVIFFFDRKDQA